MIDTIKIYTQIDKILYHKISFQQNISQKFNESTGEVFYRISSDDLKGSFDSNIHVGVGLGSKYGFAGSYFCEIECSPHKVLKGQNAYDGFYDLTYISIEVILLVEKEYNIELPAVDFWYCSRVDITKNFDLKNQKNVNKYIDSLKLLSFPRRESKKGIYKNGLYFPRKLYYC